MPHYSRQPLFKTLGTGLIAIGLAAMTPAAAQSQSLDWAQDPASQCRFVSPASLTAGPTYWVGDCIEGKASGLGMLRRRDGERAGPAFYGEIQDGVPQIGVVDDGEGYRVGAFANGDIGTEAELEPQLRLDAFRAAAMAARAVSASYLAEKNSASAQYYQAIAQTLDNQIE